jgi:hypothetical protein
MTMAHMGGYPPLVLVPNSYTDTTVELVSIPTVPDSRRHARRYGGVERRAYSRFL